MIRRDETLMLDLLEDCLSAIESGASRSDALEHARLEPVAQRELAGLLHAADALRDLPLPQLSAAEIGIQRSHLLEAAAERQAGLESARGADAGPFAGRGPWLGLLLLILAGGLIWRFGLLPDRSSLGEGRTRTALEQAEGAVPTAVPLAPAETAVPTRDLGVATAVRPASDPAPLDAAPGDVLAALAGIGQGLAGITTPSATRTAMASPSTSSTPAPPADATRKPRSTPTPMPDRSRTPSATFSPTSTASPTATLTLTPSDTATPTPSWTVTPSPTPDEPHGEAVLEVRVGRTDAGGPIAGAEVVAEREDGGPSVVAESNADGRARLVIVAGLDYRLRADATGHQRRWWPNVAERAQSQLIQLAAGQSRVLEMNLPLSLDRDAMGSAHAHP
jgi:hypothetical protein